MTPRLYAELALVVLAAGAGWGYVHQRDNALRAEGSLVVLQKDFDAKAKVARVDSARADSAVAAAARSDSARIVAERQQDAARAEGQRRAAAALVRIPAARDSVVGAAGADSAAVRARLAELEALYAEREAGFVQQIRADSVTIDGLRAVHVTDQAAIKSLQVALGSSETARAAAEEVGRAAIAARPGWIQRTAPKAAIVVAAVGGWLLRQRLKG